MKTHGPWMQVPRALQLAPYPRGSSLALCNMAERQAHRPLIQLFMCIRMYSMADRAHLPLNTPFRLHYRCRASYLSRCKNPSPQPKRKSLQPKRR